LHCSFDVNFVLYTKYRFPSSEGKTACNTFSNKVKTFFFHLAKSWGHPNKPNIHNPEKRKNCRIFHLGYFAVVGKMHTF